jgi:hypothetical protein
MRIGMCIAALGLAFMVTGSALADDAAQPPPKAAAGGAGGHHQKYGAAGCGLGSLLIHSGGIVQIFSATTNATSYTQTFGITSGTSNCDDASGASDDARVFVHANRVALAKDISRGQGETIADLSAIAGCADAKAVGQKLQASFGTIFPNASVSSDQVTDSILTTLKSDKSLACTGFTG